MDKQQCVNMILEIFPEYESVIEEHISCYGEVLLHVLSSEVIHEPLIELLCFNRKVDLIEKYCKIIEEMWKNGTDDVVNVVDVSILERLSDDEKIWQKFGTYISEDFRNHINEEVLSWNSMMQGVKELDQLIRITVTRDSVCMGDDVFDHRRTYLFGNDATYMELMELILEEQYMPTIAGNNVVWVLHNGNYKDIVSYFSLTGKIFEGLTEKSLSEICKEDKMLKFRYYPSPERRKEYIENLYHGDMHAIWHDGWDDEYKYCDFVNSLR